MEGGKRGGGGDGSGTRLADDPAAALTAAFERTNRHLVAHTSAAAALRKDLASRGATLGDDPSVVDASESGACAVVVYAKADPATRAVTLWVAGVGDCRAVIGTRDRTDGGEGAATHADGGNGGGESDGRSDGRSDGEGAEEGAVDEPHGQGRLHALALSTDHKVDLPTERARIEAHGAFVSEASLDDDDFRPARVYRSRHEPSKGPGLCIGRVLGDLDGGPEVGLIATPEVYVHTVRPADQFLLMASDGVWEFIDNEEAVAMVDSFYSKGLTPDQLQAATPERTPAAQACAFLVAKSALAWRIHEAPYRDDITLIVIWLPDLVESLLGGVQVVS